MRRRFDAPDLENALEVGKQKAGLAPVQDHRRFLISDAMAQEEKHAAQRRNAATAKESKYRKEYFLKWLESRMPDVRFWDQMTPGIADAYLEEYPGRSKRHAFRPIQSTSRFMARRHAVVNRFDGYAIHQNAPEPPVEVHLSDVHDFLEWLGENAEPAYVTGASLQSLCGLRLQEALRLSWRDIDIGHALLQIQGEVKNRYSARVIPIPHLVTAALERALDSSRTSGIVDLAGPVVPSPTGKPYTGTSWSNYAKRLGKLIRAWNKEIGWSPKDLRNAIQQLAASIGKGDDPVWEQYVGHAPRTVAAKHYLAKLTRGNIACRSRGERESLDQRMSILRREVVEQVEAHFEAARLNLFEHGLAEACVIETKNQIQTQSCQSSGVERETGFEPATLSLGS